MSNEFWQNKIKALLHDPPDKALILGTGESHEKVAAELWQHVGFKDDSKRLKNVGLKNGFPDIHKADCISAVMQRIDLPRNLREFEVYFTREPRQTLIKHTLSGEEDVHIRKFISTLKYTNMQMDKWQGGKSIEFLQMLQKETRKKAYFLLWRFLPELYDLGYLLPADTRIPDHSTWDHLDVTAAIFSSLEGGLSLFSVKIPAVQEFISHSRKLADLWAASHIFSTIIFEGIKVIAEELGPDAVIYPQLRGNPMLDLTGFNGESGKFVLAYEGERLNLIKREDTKKHLHVANFPNTFLSFIPSSEAESIAKRVEDAVKQKWREIANKTKKLLGEASITVDESLWNNQIENAIEVTSAWLDFFNLDKYKEVKDHISEDLRNTQERWLNFVQEAEKRSNYGHFYSLTYELLGIILAQKSRFWREWEEKPKTGKKCLMCGRRNALIENHIEKGYMTWVGEKEKWKRTPISDQFNQFKYVLKGGERLCSVCLVKRLYKEVFKELFKLEDWHVPEPESTVDISGKYFIDKIKDDEDFQILKLIDIELIYPHEWESKEKLEKCGVKEKIYEKLKEWWKIHGEPNKYYAILMMDGDEIGKTLSGEKLPKFGEFLHPAFKNKIEKEWGKGKDLTKEKRILTPSHHIAISRAMKDFSLHVVPKIVKEHGGFLVYAGGDDVLALFPANRVLDAAYEIQEYFRKDFYEITINGKKRRVMGLGNKASMSAGIVFAHYKWPLYDAIERVRKAERRAKEKYGRNAFCTTFIKRSGEILTAGGKWDSVKDLVDVTKAIVNGKISHRFIYDFMNVCEILSGEMLKAEIGRLLKRRREKVSDEEIRDVQGEFLCLIEKYKVNNLSAKELGNLLKILYDAYRGEER